MAQTSPIINFGTYDALGYKQDSTPACSVALQSFSKIDDLKMHAAANKYPYASFEPDLWLLDGSFKIKPVVETSIHAGLTTAVQSDSAGRFDNPQRLTVTFGSAHDTDGIQLTFDAASNDYANNLTVAYYNAANALIRTDNYFPTGALFIASQVVTAFKKIIITFNSTNKPYRFLRLLDIDYCITTYFSGDEIKDASVVEEICPTSTELPYNTLDFRLLTENPLFSIVAPEGSYALLQYRQPMFVYEQVDAVVYPIGKFFIDTWKNQSEKEIAIRAIDTIGVLDATEYRGAQIDEIAILFFGADLLYPLGIGYTVDASLATINIKGVLPSGTYRDALQQACLAIGAYATCTRSGTVDIHAMELVSTIVTPDFEITAAEKSGTQTVDMKTLVTGVEVSSHDYASSGVTKIVYGPKAWVAPATFRIEFTDIWDGLILTVTGATVVDSGANFFVLSVTVDGDVTVEIGTMLDLASVSGIYDTGLPAGTLQNIIKITEGALVSQSIQAATIQRLYDYYHQRYKMKIRLFALPVKVGDSILVDTTNARQIVGIVEKASVNLSGGFISDLEIIGIVKPL